MSLRKAAALAFEELESALRAGSASSSGAASEGPTARGDEALQGLPAKSALFVTWTKSGRLRGCIGTFSPLPLEKGIREYALIAALHDTRFDPIVEAELPSLEVAVTLLGPLEAIEDPLDWEIGEHGVKAVFPGGRSSTFLPDVPAEQGWTKEQTLEELAYKAGVNSLKGLKMSRYDGRKAELTYNEYKRESGNR